MQCRFLVQIVCKFEEEIERTHKKKEHLILYYAHKAASLNFVDVFLWS